MWAGFSGPLGQAELWYVNEWISSGINRPLSTNFELFEAYRVREFLVRMRRRAGSGISLNDSFSDDLESGLSSRNFDLISQNDNDPRPGLDDSSKAEIKRIMEQENLSFDKARFLYVERKFGQNEIAPDGTPMDPKAVTFNK